MFLKQCFMENHSSASTPSTGTMDCENRVDNGHSEGCKNLMKNVKFILY